jgi:hypothetical protein
VIEAEISDLITYYWRAHRMSASDPDKVETTASRTMKALEHLREVEAKLGAARTAMSKLMDKLDETSDGLGDWHDATEYIDWARSEVRDAWLAAGGGQ